MCIKAMVYRRVDSLIIASLPNIARRRLMKCNGMYLKSIFSFTIMSKLVRSNISKMSRGDQKLFKNYVSYAISFLRKGILSIINA